MNINNCTGIYGIYIDGMLVYIGKTTTSFQKRFSQHKHLIDFPENSDTQYDMYYELALARAQDKSVYLKPIFVVEEVEYISLYKLTNRDIESMEFILINLHKPKYNICGVKKPYKYTC